MTEKEHEFKMMLNKDKHHFLLRFFDKLMVESGLQTNYSPKTERKFFKACDGIIWMLDTLMSFSNHTANQQQNSLSLLTM